ncbi:MAG: glycoside hydrolase 100 family protein [Opitutales bacterium]
MNKETQENNLIDAECYRAAVDLLHRCKTTHGFIATPKQKSNYSRIWGRDSSITGLAALLSGDDELIDGLRLSLKTLAQHQGLHGEIPSNVDPDTQRVSYGGTAGRVDADLWFVIACGEYWRQTGDDAFLESMLAPLEKVRFLLGAWEYNTRGLIYVPPTGDWADEYMQSGYVLYDQLLYLQALKAFCAIHRFEHDSDDHALDEKVARLEHLIRANYWFTDCEDTPKDVYHSVLFEKARKAAPHCRGTYWMPFFSPFGYGYRFDSLANSLVMLFQVAEEWQSEAVDDYIAEHIVPEKIKLLPAFNPVITPKDEDWDDLQTTFSHTFKNEPYEYHNGGLWPMVTGFYAAGLASRNKMHAARTYCRGIHEANQNNKKEEDGFPEFLHGKHFTPGGTRSMAWSAAAAVLAEQYIAGKRLFGEPDAHSASR